MFRFWRFILIQNESTLQQIDVHYLVVKLNFTSALITKVAEDEAVLSFSLLKR